MGCGLDYGVEYGLETAVERHQAVTGSINMHMTFDLSELKERRLNRSGSSIRQSRRQLVVALVTFVVCVQLL